MNVASATIPAIPMNVDERPPAPFDALFGRLKEYEQGLFDALRASRVLLLGTQREQPPIPSSAPRCYAAATRDHAHE